MYSEFNWKLLESLTPEENVLFRSFRQDLIESNGMPYTQCFYEKRAPLHKCIEFLDGTKLFMERPNRNTSNEQMCWSDYKIAHCLMHLTITPLCRQVLSIYRTGKRCHHDVMLFRKLGLNNALRMGHSVQNEYLYVYVDRGLASHGYELVF